MAKIVFSTGAGISVPSGIPPYRGTGGIYTENPELEQMLDASKLAHSRSRVFDAVAKMRSIVDQCKPNAAHYAISELQDHHDVTVITQNVDGFHIAAGSKTVLELHGNLYREHFDDDGPRPSVVLFGEDLPAGVFNDALLAVENSDVFIAVGTSGTVWPAATLLDVANDRKYMEGPNFKFFFINADRPEINLPFARLALGSADELVPDLCEYLKVEDQINALEKNWHGTSD